MLEYVAGAQRVARYIKTPPLKKNEPQIVLQYSGEKLFS